MDFVFKKLDNVLKISSVVNLHFFEFQKIINLCDIIKRIFDSQKE